MEFFLLFLKLIIAFGIVIALMYLLYKVSDTKIQQINKTKYIKVLERTQVSKDNNLILVKLGNKAYVMSSSVGKSEIVKELDDNELLEYEASKIESNYDSIITNYFKKKQKDENYE